MPFIPGIPLCEAFYWQAVRPILDEAFPALPHSAARISDARVRALPRWVGSVNPFVESVDGLDEVAE